jgi:hypothetical protein
MANKPSNLQSVNAGENTALAAPGFFNNFYQPSFTVSQNIDDMVTSYFEKITDNKQSAKLMASSVIYTSLAQGVDPIETLQKFSSLSAADMSAYTAMFLNLNRVGTSYLGINNRPKTGKYVKRLIRP